MQNQQIKAVALPTDPDDVVTRAFAEQLLNNRVWKDPVRVAVNSNVNTASPGATLDGVTLAPGNRVLLYGQSTQNQNGIYIWNGAAVAMTRAPDADTGTELLPGSTFAVLEGTTNADRLAILISDGVITVGTTSLQFVVMSTTGAVYTASSGLQLIAGAFSVLLDTASGLIVSGTGLKIDPSVVVRKFAANIGNGSATTVTVTHNLGTRDLTIGLFHIASNRKWLEDLELIDVNSFNLNFGTAPAANALRIVVQA